MARGFGARENTDSRKLQIASGAAARENLKQLDRKIDRIVNVDVKDAVRDELNRASGPLQSIDGLTSKAFVGENFSSKEIEKIGDAILSARRYHEKSSEGFDGDDDDAYEANLLQRDQTTLEYVEDELESIYTNRMSKAEREVFNVIKAEGKNLAIKLPGGKSVELSANEWRPGYDFDDAVPVQEAKDSFETVFEKAQEGAFGSGVASKLGKLKAEEKTELGALVNKTERALNSFGRFDQIYRRLSNAGKIPSGPSTKNYNAEKMMERNQAIVTQIEDAAINATEKAISAFLRNR